MLKEKADFDSYKPRPFNMREFYDRTGHDIKDMLLACHYRGSECSAEDFTVVSGDLVGIALVAHLKVFLHPYPTNADQPTNQPTSSKCAGTHWWLLVLFYFCCWVCDLPNVLKLCVGVSIPVMDNRGTTDQLWHRPRIS